MRFWVSSIAVTFLWPSCHALGNPFIAPVTAMISERRTLFAMWIALVSGLFRDVILSSPRFGLLGLSSLIGATIVNHLFRYVSFEGTPGRVFLAFLMSIFEGVLTPFLMTGSWSWRTFVLGVSLTLGWMVAIELCGWFLSLMFKGQRRTCGEDS